jgi:hypothetical protein
MRVRQSLTEAELEAIERRADPNTIAQLVSTIRQQQHDLDSLQLSLEVARRDREELRAALLAAQQRIRKLAGVRKGAGPEAEGGNPTTDERSS